MTCDAFSVCSVVMDLARRQEDNGMMVHGKCCVDHDCTHDPEKSIGYESEEEANEPKKIPKSRRPTVEKVRRRPPSLSRFPAGGCWRHPTGSRSTASRQGIAARIRPSPRRSRCYYHDHQTKPKMIAHFVIAAIFERPTAAEDEDIPKRTQI